MSWAWALAVIQDFVNNWFTDSVTVASDRGARKDEVVQPGLLCVWVRCTCTCTRSRSYSFTTSFCNTSFVLQFQFQKPLFKFSNFSSLALTHCKLVPSALPLTQPSSSRKDFDFVVVNFYHFVFIQDPQAEVAKHRSFLELEVRFHFLFIITSFYFTLCL